MGNILLSGKKDEQSPTELDQWVRNFLQVKQNGNVSSLLNAELGNSKRNKCLPLSELLRYGLKLYYWLWIRGGVFVTPPFKTYS
jgi:hypothetical protein